MFTEIQEAAIGIAHIRARILELIPGKGYEAGKARAWIEKIEAERKSLALVYKGFIEAAAEERGKDPRGMIMQWFKRFQAEYEEDAKKALEKLRISPLGAIGDMLAPPERAKLAPAYTGVRGIEARMLQMAPGIRRDEPAKTTAQNTTALLKVAQESQKQLVQVEQAIDRLGEWQEPASIL